MMFNTYSKALLYMNSLKEALDKHKCSYKIDNGVVTVFNKYKGAEEVSYHLWDLYLTNETTKKLGSTVEFKMHSDINGTRFAISTAAKYDLTNYITITNRRLHNEVHDFVVFLGENIPNSDRKLCISTMNMNGSWTRVEFNKSEVLFCAVNSFFPTLHESGKYYYYTELAKIYDDFNAEGEELHRNRK